MKFAMGNVELLLYLCRVKREKEHRKIFRCQWDTNGNITGLNSHASINAVGRVIEQHDASGFRVFRYGKLGEVTRDTRTFVVP